MPMWDEDGERDLGKKTDKTLTYRDDFSTPGNSIQEANLMTKETNFKKEHLNMLHFYVMFRIRHFFI